MSVEGLDAGIYFAGMKENASSNNMIKFIVLK
jgi:hypothetical protein